MPKPVKTQRSQWILSVTSGLMLALAFPKAGLGWMAWCALVPLLLALRKVTARTGFKLSFAAGMVSNLGLMYWTVHSMRVYGYLPIIQSISVLVLLAAVLALFTAGFGMTLFWLCRRSWQLLVLAPFVWVAFEFLRSWLFTGFPWELLGYSQYQYPWMIQIADLFGVFGISALIVYINVVLTLALLFWTDKSWQTDGISKKLVLRGGIILVFFLVMAGLYSLHRIRSIDEAVANAPKTSMAVVQGNIDQAHKWDSAFQVLTTVKYKNLSMAAAQKGADLIVWPETATPFYLFHDQLLTQMVLDGIKASKTAYIIGSPSAAGERDEQLYYNSAYLIDPHGEIAGKYDKVHLVPFGEYVPLKRLLWFVDKMVAQVGDFKAGHKGRILEWDQFRIGMQICYEVIFSDLSRAMVQNGANVLVNITNDAWFGRTSAASQHFSMAVLRAVENRRFLARAANTGISGFIDPCGRIMGATPLFEEAVLVSEIALLNQKTYYSRWGDWPMAIFCFGLPAAGGAFRAVGGRKSAGKRFSG